jgi:hypothetical protein
MPGWFEMDCPVTDPKGLAQQAVNVMTSATVTVTLLLYTE